jgi:hypothetical protein
MGKTIGCFLSGILTLAISAVVLFFLLWAVSNPRISDESDAEFFEETNLLELGQQLLFEESSTQFVRVTVKERLGAVDAIVNVLYVFVVGLSTLVFFILAGIFFIIKGFITASWIDIIGGLLAIIAALIAPFAIWGTLMFQYGTPAYYLIMLLGGLPASIAGLVFGAIFPVTGSRAILIIFE